MGIRGIALATLCSQLFGLIYIILKVNKTNFKKFLNPECFIPKYNLQKEILSQTIPATISMMLIGLGVFVLLFYVSTYGDYSAGGYGAAIRFEQLFLLPVLGLNASTLALVGQNFGAMNFSEFMKHILDQFFMALYLWVSADCFFFFIRLHNVFF